MTSNDKKVPVTFQLLKNNVNFGDPVVLDGVVDAPNMNGSCELSPWVYTWKNILGEDPETFETYTYSVVEHALVGYKTLKLETPLLIWNLLILQPEKSLKE